MDIKSLKIYRNIEDTLKKRQKEEQKIMIARARNSTAWQNHAGECKSAQIITLDMNGISLDDGQERLDSNLWRKSLEQKTEKMLDKKDELNSDNFSINASVYSTDTKNMNVNNPNTGDYVGGNISSPNFSTNDSNGSYDHVKFSVGCMCGAHFDVDGQEESKSNDYGVTNSSVAGIYTASKKKEENNTYSN
tara:strand:- start:3980 stop:4552 length:573 start_codon:yes stop_codon:yes gene_type:complete